MTLLQDGLIAFLSAVGLTALVWLVAGAVLHTGRPIVPGLLLVLPLRGEAPAGGPGSWPRRITVWMCGSCGGSRAACQEHGWCWWTAD